VLALHDRYCEVLKAANPDFQTEHGYPRASPDTATLTMASKHVAHAFGCLAMTLEQPFKDSAITPDPINGWSPGRCAALGRSCLDALCAVIDDLRVPQT
jgi:murein tripeptide amidase MpaA